MVWTAHCALDGADHIVDFKTLRGLSDYDNTSTVPGATPEEAKSCDEGVSRLHKGTRLGAAWHTTRLKRPN